MAKGCVYILQSGKDAGKIFGSKDSLAAHMNYTPAMADLMAKYEKSGGKMDVGSVTKWLTDNGYLKAEAKKPTTEAAPKPTTAAVEQAKPEVEKTNPKQQKTLFRFFEKAFYEGKNKRYDNISDETVDNLSDDTKNYLLSLYEALKPFNSTYQRLGKIIDKQTSKEITSDKDKIKYVTSSYFGGFGRPSSELGSSVDPKHSDLVFPIPSNEVVSNINEVFGAKLTAEESTALSTKSNKKPEVKKPTAEGAPKPTTAAVEQAKPGDIVQKAENVEVSSIQEKTKIVNSKIKKSDVFEGVGQFSKKLGGSNTESVPVGYSETGNAETVQYANPQTGVVDIIVSAMGDNDFVGFYRIYENGKPTNKWSSKFETQAAVKEDFKNMISAVQNALPQGHEYTETTSISTDGLRVWDQQLNRGYELQYHENGKLITTSVFINGDAKTNILGVPVNKGEFDPISVTNENDFNKVKKALLPYLEKFGLGEKNIRLRSGSVQIDLPVLKQSAAQKDTQVGSKTKSTQQLTTKKEFPKAPVTDAVKTALKSVDNTTAAIMNLAKVLPTVYESIAKQVKLSIGKPASQQIAEAYHNAVENGVEPELVAAVENGVALQEQMKSKPSLADNIETAETLEMEGVPNGVRVSNKASMADLERKHAGNAVKKATIAMARAAAKTLKSVFPMMDIHLHENTADYNNAMTNLGAQLNTAGNFTYSTSTDGTTVGRIDINLNRATPRTVVHEVTHAVLLKTFGDSSPAFLEFRKNLEKIISKSGNKKLSDFADKYKDIADDIGQAEEYLAELGGILSDKETPLEYGLVRRIAEMINKAVSAITFGRIKPFEDLQNQKDTLEFFNSIAQTIKAGQGYDINSMGLHGEIKATGIKSKASISSGEILQFDVNPNVKMEEEVPLSRFNGKVTNLMESDRMVGGYIADEKGNALFKFYGGVRFSPITGKWWASRTNSKAKGIAQNANKNRDADGYIYSSPMIGSEKQHMSNADMMFTTIELMKEDVKNKKSKVTKADVVEIMNKALDRKKIAEKRDAFKSFFKAKNIVEMFDELEFILFQEGIEDPNAVKPAKGEKKEKEKKYLADRNGNLMLTEQENKIPVFSFEDRLTIVQTLLGDPKVKEPRFPMAGSITDTAKRFTEPVAGRAEKVGDIVMIMRTKGTLKHKKTPTTDEFYHRSYPYEIYSVNEDGTPAEIEVFFLDGAYSMQDVLPELKKSNGDMFSYKEYAEKHAAKTAAYVEAQYNRTAKLAYASGEIKSKAQVVYDETGFITTDSMIEIVKANDPTYLGDVMNHILDMGEKLRSGNVGPKDLAKAYMMAVSSIQSKDQPVRNFENAIGEKVDEVFVEKERGTIRPEGAMAYLLTTPEGKRMLDNIDRGKIDAKDRAFIANSMRPFGMYGEGQSKFNNLFGTPEGKQINLTNINEFADMLKGGVQDEQKFFNDITKLKGISQAKVGFVTNFLGIGTRGVIDTREIKGWLRGVAFMDDFTESEAAMNTQLTKSLKNLTPLQSEILRRMRVVGEAMNIEPALAEYIGHHMIWDAVKNERTTHDGLYLAMKQNEDDFNNRLAEIKAKPELKTKAQIVTVEPIDFENESENIDVYEASEQASKIAKDNGVNILRGKDLKSVALDDEGNVVGGLWTEISGDEFSFDVAVDKSMQGKGVGEKLVNEAISEFNAENFEDQLKYKVDVTNPVMEKLLSKYGFEVTERIDGHTMMEHPTNNPKLILKTKAQMAPEEVTDRLKNEGYDIGDGITIRNEPGNQGTTFVKNFSFYKDGKEIGYLGTVPAESFYRDRKDFPFKDSNFYVVDAGNMSKGVMIYDKSMRRKGLGSKMYEAAQEYLQKQDPNARLASSSQIGQTEESYKLWKKLYEQGKADIIYTEPEGGNIYYGEDVGRDFGRGGGEPNGVIYDGNVYALKQTPGLKSKAQMVDNNAKQVADLYAQMREGGGWAERQKINAILDQDPKLSYIYNNFKAITQMLEEAELLTKSGNCP